MATSDFMKFPATFEANLNFFSPKENEAFLVFYNDNPSGLPENSDMMSVPVKISQEKTKIILYFGKEGDDSCKNNHPVEREIIKVEGIAKATIEELLKGLNQAEKDSGYFTSIPEGVKINSLTIIDGTAKIDFNETLEQGVGGSCRVLAIREQIIQTLMQFSSVKKVIISINGRTEDILQP
jgi:spore germination protein GerM